METIFSRNPQIGEKAGELVLTCGKLCGKHVDRVWKRFFGLIFSEILLKPSLRRLLACIRSITEIIYNSMQPRLSGFLPDLSYSNAQNCVVDNCFSGIFLKREV